MVKISSYRIYKYPLHGAQFRHIYFTRTLRLGNSRTVSECPTKLDRLNEAFAKLDPSLCRSRRIIRDLIYCNKFDYFCTFTFSPQKVDRYDFAICKKKITKLFMNYKNRYSPEFRYLLVPERHKDGAWHFHGMISGIRAEDFSVPLTIWVHPNKHTDKLVEVPNIHRYVDWLYYSKKLGFFNCSLIRNYERCAVYVSKYVTKDLADVQSGQRVILASANLERPELVFDFDDIPYSFVPEYEDDFCKISWCGEKFTVGTYIFDDESFPPKDTSFYEDSFASAIFEPLCGEQLKM